MKNKTASFCLIEDDAVLLHGMSAPGMTEGPREGCSGRCDVYL